jgi:hypothetical protein
MLAWGLRVGIALVLSIALGACGGKAHTTADSDGGAEPGPDITGDGGDPTHPMNGRFVAPLRQGRVDKVDVLLMIDNSSSMADKQALLATAVPDLVGRLTNPVCVDPTSHQQVGMRNPDGSCSAGEPDFDPVKDMHIGIISSSLGGHGTSGVCDQPDSRKTFPHNDDRAHLLTRGPMDAAISTMGGKPFLNWNPAMGGYADAAALAMPFATMITGVGQHGCGYEASLESIYRFLIDPDPYDTIVIDKSVGGLGAASLTGTDLTLLAQRADFLRPDSAVVVVMVTDENDCSIIDGGQNFYSIVPPSGSPPKSILTHGTSGCLDNPNGPCCFSCLQHNTGDDPPPDGCPAPGNDSECMKGQWLKTEDPENLRCFNQKQRYGIDFLYPVQRYIDGFTKSQVVDRHGNGVQNPLYSDLKCMGAACAAERDKRNVLLAGIVGVPWQDIANDPTTLGSGYKTAAQLRAENVWQKILGDPQPAGTSRPLPPTDPHMIESVLPRASLPGPDSPTNADPINGHEWDPTKASPANADLQYACTFPLPVGGERNCTDSTDCDCANPTGGMVADMKKPLCQGPGGYSTLQVAAKAYPGIRELQVLRGLSDQAVVASICPSNVTDSTRSDYGYRPAITAIVTQMRPALRGQCFPTVLSVDPNTKQVACNLIEVFNPPPGIDCSCEATQSGRVTAPDSHLTEEMKAKGSCRCEIHQLSDATDNGAATACRTEGTPSRIPPPGWCYVDPSQNGPADCALVRDCGSDKRLIRFANPVSEPRNDASVYLACEANKPISSQPLATCP